MDREVKLLQDRLITQKLRKFALKEYKEKRPTEIFGYRVKKSILLQRGFGPSIILSGLKGKVAPFLILANYGDHYRLYFILENGVTLNAINIPAKEFERERLKFQKATTQLFQIPRPEVPKKKLEKIKKQINEKFHQYVALIEKQTSCKIKNVPIITIYQSPVESKLVIKRERDFIKLPLELISHKLIDGFIAREAYRQLFPVFIRKTEHSKLFGLIGTFFLLPKTLKEDWLQYWEPKVKFKKKLTQINEPLFNLLLRFLWYLGKHEISPFSDAQLKKIYKIFPKLAKKTENLPDIAAQCYLQLANHKGYFILKASFFFILANRLKDARQALKELSKFTQSDEIRDLRIQCEYLLTFQLAKIYSSDLNLESYAPDVQGLFSEILNHIKNQVLEVKRIHKQKGSPSKSIKIKFNIRNLSDLTLNNIKLVDNLPKKSQAEVVGPNSFNFSQLSPKQNVTCKYKITSNVPQKIWFKNGNLTFQDSHGNHYVQTISSTVLHIE